MTVTTFDCCDVTSIGYANKENYKFEFDLRGFFSGKFSEITIINSRGYNSNLEHIKIIERKRAFKCSVKKFSILIFARASRIVRFN